MRSKPAEDGIGRPLKLDRGEIIACVVALREWLTMDHAARIARVQERVDATIARLHGVRGLTATSVPNAHFGAPGLRGRPDPSANYTAERLAAALQEGSPSIWTHHDAEAVHCNLTTVAEGDEAVIAARLRELLAA